MANALINKTITAVKISEDKDALLFITNDNAYFVAEAQGDCCSSTWVESIELPAMGFPFTILGVEDLDLDISPEETDWEYIQFYGAKFATTKGDMVIDYRNSSNGWYGGWMEWPVTNTYMDNLFQSTYRWVDVIDCDEI